MAFAIRNKTESANSSEKSCADIWNPLSKSAKLSSRVPWSGRSCSLRDVIRLIRWFFAFWVLAHMQSPKRQSYSNRNRAPTVMRCAVPCEQDHGPVDGEGDRHCSLDCSECLKRPIRLHGPPQFWSGGRVGVRQLENAPMSHQFIMIGIPGSRGCPSRSAIRFANFPGDKAPRLPKGVLVMAVRSFSGRTISSDT
jgi:hypothetical protein